jgi:Gram-negative bacterial TonB protein C-terminal
VSTKTSVWSVHTTPLSLALLGLALLNSAGSLGALQASGSACDSTASLPPSFPAESVDTKPSITHHARSLRSPRALSIPGVTGQVLLEYDVEPTGAVDPCSLHVLSATGPEFAASAESYATGLRFTPGIKNGVFVRTRVRQRIHFPNRNGARGKHHVF